MLWFYVDQSIEFFSYAVGATITNIKMASMFEIREKKLMLSLYRDYMLIKMFSHHQQKSVFKSVILNV